MWWTKNSSTYLKVELDWTWTWGEIKLNLCRCSAPRRGGPAPPVLWCADEEGGRRHHDRQHLVRRHRLDDTMFDDTLFDDTMFDDTMFGDTMFDHTLFDDTMFNFTMFDNASLLHDSMPHNVKLHKPFCWISKAASWLIHILRHYIRWNFRKMKKKYIWSRTHSIFHSFFDATSWILPPSIFPFLSFFWGKGPAFKLSSRHSAGTYCKLGKSGLKSYAIQSIWIFIRLALNHSFISWTVVNCLS